MRSWIGKEVIYAFSSPQQVGSTAFGRDSTGGAFDDRWAGTYTLSYQNAAGGAWHDAGAVVKGGPTRERFVIEPPLLEVIALRLTTPGDQTCVDEWEVYSAFPAGAGFDQFPP